jgi:hypothetical protein
MRYIDCGAIRGAIRKSCHGKPKIINIETFNIAIQFQDLNPLRLRYFREQRIHKIHPA